MADYNLLTKRLLAEGYDENHYPSHVQVAGGQFGSGNKLNNLYGGFEYKRTFTDARTYRTPCGLSCKGISAFDMHWIHDYTHENDNPIINCPTQCDGCRHRPEPFASARDDYHCPVKATKKEYDQIHSVEAEKAKFEAWRSQKKDEYLTKHPRYCKNHLFWDAKAKEWRFHYSPLNCRNYNCIGKECPVLGKIIRPDKGNIFYDLEANFPDRSKDGTFFEGERITEKTIGIQYFDKPELLDICEACIKAEKEHILWIIKTNKVAKMYGSWMLFQARLGKVDFSYTISNMRAEKRNARDLEEDIRNAENGIFIRSAAEEERKEKERKREKRDQAKEKKIEQARKLIIRKGLDGMEEYERKKVIKLLDSSDIVKAQHEHDAEQRRKENAPVQMSLFDMLTEEG